MRKIKIIKAADVPAYTAPKPSPEPKPKPVTNENWITETRRALHARRRDERERFNTGAQL